MQALSVSGNYLGGRPWKRRPLGPGLRLSGLEQQRDWAADACASSGPAAKQALKAAAKRSAETVACWACGPCACLALLVYCCIWGENG